MRTLIVFLSLFFVTSYATGRDKEKNYTGSTPAAPSVRAFLGIPLSDSIDFIRWQLSISDNQYNLHCSYGIGKANTNGFINDGKNTGLSGKIKKGKNYLQLVNGNKTLRIVELNEDLLHLLDANDDMMVGNAGWSYTLNSLAPAVTDQFYLTPKQTPLMDSMSFEGRTPCSVPGVIAPGAECYKLKWYIVFYAHVGSNETGTYRIPGSPWYNEGGRNGTWKIITGKDGRIIYQLKDDKKKDLLYLLKLDDHVLIFIDAAGKLLVGNEDFSYTMNRKW